MTDANDSYELDATATWGQSVADFEREAASWLTAADAPQLVTLRAIAKELDGGTFQAALISQFTLVHRALLGRRPGGNPKPTKPGGDGDDLGLFGAWGGEVWQS